MNDETKIAHGAETEEMTAEETAAAQECMTAFMTTDFATTVSALKFEFYNPAPPEPVEILKSPSNGINLTPEQRAEGMMLLTKIAEIEGTAAVIKTDVIVCELENVHMSVSSIFQGLREAGDSLSSEFRSVVSEYGRMAQHVLSAALITAKEIHEQDGHFTVRAVLEDLEGVFADAAKAHWDTAWTAPTTAAQLQEMEQSEKLAGCAEGVRNIIKYLF